MILAYKSFLREPGTSEEIWYFDKDKNACINSGAARLENVKASPVEYWIPSTRMRTQPHSLVDSSIF
jgi:hypothetical protein